MDPMAVKGITMALIGFGSCLMGLIPLKLARVLKWTKDGCDRSPSSQVALSAFLCFGGGVLLATAFVHMLPEVRQSLEVVMGHSDTSHAVPWAEVLLCAGLFLVYFIEELAHHLLYGRTHPGHEHHHHDHHNQREHEEHCQQQAVWLDGDIRRNGLDSLHDHSTKRNFYGSTEAPAENGHPLLKAAPLPVDEETKPHHESQLRSMLALLALSVHSLLEGMAVGLQQTSNDVWYLFGAIATHKYVIAFCIGMELASAGATLSYHISYIVLFAVMSPIGVAIGIFITMNDVDASINNPAVAVCQAMAAGTLLYVTFFEVLQRERTKCHAGLLQFFAVLMGFITMVLIETLGGHGHSEMEDNVLLNTTVMNSVGL